MSDDEPSDTDSLPDKLDVVKITKADGCVWEYKVQNLRLEYIGIPESHRKPGEALGSLELEADDVYAVETCSPDQIPRPSPPFDHVSLRVSDMEACKAFYLAALRALDFEVLYEFPEFVGLGAEDRASLWLAADAEEPSAHVHLCFEAQSREVVDSFHAASLATGGRCHGPPGLRPQYHPGYYAAFVLDPNGNNLEVVFHDRALATEEQA